MFRSSLIILMMHIDPASSAVRWNLSPWAARAWLVLLPLAGLLLCGPSRAVEFGPFSLTGFAKAEAQRGSNHCIDCQKEPGPPKGYALKDEVWADELVPGQPFKTTTTHVVLFQPWLGARFDLGGGFKLSGLVSQRWRDGNLDIPGFMYDKNVALSHEDYGRVAIGAMTSRAWSVADYPYGTNIGVADAWASSGAGYGLLGHAARYTSRVLDVLEGDLVLEATYDEGNTGFKRNKPRFVELYAQFHKGDLVVDAMLQVTRNGTPSAWGHGPFTGLTPFPADDGKLGGSGQSIAMVMARYQLDSRFEVTGGLRRNLWSGAYAVCTANCGPKGQWNNMFNVDWGGSLNGVPNPGYGASSVDGMMGLRYRTGPWVAHTGMAYLGRARTANPSERGQSNWTLINTLGLGYEYKPGLQFYTLAGMVHYGRLGLSAMSMPGNDAFTNVDSRVSRSGNWFGAGAVWVW